jgi:hypothetical protein
MFSLTDCEKIAKFMEIYSNDIKTFPPHARSKSTISIFDERSDIMEKLLNYNMCTLITHLLPLCIAISALFDSSTTSVDRCSCRLCWVVGSTRVGSIVLTRYQQMRALEVELSYSLLSFKFLSIISVVLIYSY